MTRRFFHITRFHGRAVEFRNGLSLGFRWVHGNGQTTKTSAILASYHPPASITWRWALYWIRPKKPFQFSISRQARRYGAFAVTLPLIGGLDLRWQPYMWEKVSAHPSEPCSITEGGECDATPVAQPIKE